MLFFSGQDPLKFIHVGPRNNGTRIGQRCKRPLNALYCCGLKAALHRSASYPGKGRPACLPGFGRTHG